MARITLFGQSAGGASVDYYSMAWLEDPIVNSFIAESGFATDVPSPAGGANTSAGWYSASQSLGCGGVDAGESTLACMQSKPWRAISDALTKRGVTPNTGAGGFGPTVDGKVVFADVTKRRQTGRFIQKVPTRSPLAFYSPWQSSALTVTSRSWSALLRTRRRSTSFLRLSAVSPQKTSRISFTAGLDPWLVLVLTTRSQRGATFMPDSTPTRTSDSKVLGMGARLAWSLVRVSTIQSVRVHLRKSS